MVPIQQIQHSLEPAPTLGSASPRQTPNLSGRLLPFGAHGLHLLRELVTVRACTIPHEAVRALEPAIRGMFL